MVAIVDSGVHSLRDGRCRDCQLGKLPPETRALHVPGWMVSGSYLHSGFVLIAARIHRNRSRPGSRVSSCLRCLFPTSSFHQERTA
nr:putative integron gene cassette protein [uncultured bacterium]CAP47780.1 putative integron gene cassette protein [uncultured bacterium]